MTKIAYSELWDQLLNKIENPHCFDWDKYNLIKIFQHAFNAASIGNKNVIRNYYLLPLWVFQGILFAKSFKNRRIIQSKEEKIIKCPPRKFVLFAGGNIVKSKEGQLISANSERLMAVLGKEKCLYLYNPAKRAIIDTGQELNSADLEGIRSSSLLNKEEIKILVSLKKHIRQITKTGLLTEPELEHYKSQIQILFNAYRDWRHFFEIIQPEKVYFSPHYFNEGLILACRLGGISAIELQHGLISREDYYYVYPKEWASAMQRALMADKILVFGEFWKTELMLGSEYPEKSIQIIGKYQYHPLIEEHDLIQFRQKHAITDQQQIIAIACQTNNPEFYADYTKRLAKMLAYRNDIVIVIKPHPRQLGIELLQECCSHSNVRMMEKTENLMLLLNQSIIQISIYSTTFFDALGTGVINMSLQDSGTSTDYAKTMVEQGIALPLMQADNPLEIAKSVAGNKMPSIDEVYAPFNTSFYTY